MAINPTNRNLPPQISGDDIEIPLKFKESGASKDISNWTVGIDLEKTEDGDQTADLNVNNSSHDDATNGETNVTIDSSDSSGLKGEYAYDLYYEDDNGKKKTFLYGKVEFVAPAAER